MITSAISGSPTSSPNATTMALSTTPRLTSASARAWSPSAPSAGLLSLRPARVRTCAATRLPAKSDQARERQNEQTVGGIGVEEPVYGFVRGDTR